MINLPQDFDINTCGVLTGQRITENEIGFTFSNYRKEIVIKTLDIMPVLPNRASKRNELMKELLEKLQLAMDIDIDDLGNFKNLSCDPDTFDRVKAIN